MKKIKLTLITALFALICILTLPVAIRYADAASAYDEMDRLFQSTLCEILDYENSEDTYISAEKEMLYDIALNPLGILYRFDCQDTDGFAIVINNGIPAVTEISTDCSAPFDESDDTKVYVNIGMYWFYDGASYYDCISGLQVTDESVELVAETAFYGGINLYYAAENVYYLYRSETPYNIAAIPEYDYGLINGCAGVAGSNIIAYYDRWHTNLIPNYDPGTLFLGIYRYKISNATTNALAETLHYDMGTNTQGAGTTVTQFKNGLTAYANRQGYSLTHTSLMSSGKINFESAKSVVQSKKAIALFLGGFRTVNITTFSDHDNLAYEYSDVNHVVAGFGCLEVNYTLTNYQARTDRYIHCSMGVGLYLNGYINTAVTAINDAYAINIA